RGSFSAPGIVVERPPGRPGAPPPPPFRPPAPREGGRAARERAPPAAPPARCGDPRPSPSGRIVGGAKFSPDSHRTAAAARTGTAERRGAMFGRRHNHLYLKLKSSLRVGLFAVTSKVAQPPQETAASRFPAGWLPLLARAHARVSKEVIKNSAVRADSSSEFTTAEASMATIDVRQVERNAGRRKLGVAVLAFAGLLV